MDAVTPTGSEIKDNYPMVTTSNASVQTTVGHIGPASLTLQLMSEGRDVLAGSLHGSGRCGRRHVWRARVTGLGLELGICARAEWLYIRTPTQTESNGQSIQTRNVQHRWRGQTFNSSVGSGFGVGQLRAR